MSTPMKIMDVGRKGFWMRADYNLNVRIVNGTMFRLLNAKNAFTLTRILSPHLGRQIVRAWLYRNGRWILTADLSGRKGVFYGLYGLRISLNGQNLENSTKSRKLRVQKEQADTSLNTYSSLPFSRLSGLKDGSASDTLKAFRNRRKPTAGQ